MRPVLVTGTPRSGTSVVAAIFARCGAFHGECLGADRHNPTGYYEHRQAMVYVRRMLWRLRIDQEGNGGPVTLFAEQAAAAWGGMQEAKVLRKYMLDVMHGEGYDGRRPWLFKSPTLALVWPLWRAAFPDAVWVYVSRDKTATVASICNYLAMSKIRDPLWYVKQRTFLTQSMPRPACWLHHQQLIAACYDRDHAEYAAAGHVASVRRTAAAAGLCWTDAALDHVLTTTKKKDH